MAALQDHRPAAQGQQVACRPLHLGPAADLAVQQHLRLREVGCDHEGEGDQPLAQRPHRVVTQQPVSALGHHHRVHHQGSKPVLLDRPRHQLDDLPAAQHPGLRGGGPEVGDDVVDLGADDVQRELGVVAHAHGALGGHGGDRAGPVHAQGGERLEVGLDARAAARVRAGDGEGDGQPHLETTRTSPA